MTRPVLSGSVRNMGAQLRNQPFCMRVPSLDVKLGSPLLLIDLHELGADEAVLERKRDGAVIDDLARDTVLADTG